MARFKFRSSVPGCQFIPAIQGNSPGPELSRQGETSQNHEQPDDSSSGDFPSRTLPAAHPCRSVGTYGIARPSQQGAVRSGGRCRWGRGERGPHHTSRARFDSPFCLLCDAKSPENGQISPMGVVRTLPAAPVSGAFSSMGSKACWVNTFYQGS
ncbi:hypothetical protein KIL84_005329 [Mauremys mutica]|uniref:Uncharacterized protein n=1 Tax=Mauremys mutica TaxID=74926 RepID=A0A9D4B4Y2_9SAUR|nr:hypothetical protein KIL84_005329 [Mauremys mutica]